MVLHLGGGTVEEFQAMSDSLLSLAALHSRNSWKYRTMAQQRIGMKHKHRINSIDFVRGVAVVVVGIDHIDGSSVAIYSPRDFVFFDMTEVLVFLSGLMCGFMFGGVLKDSGFAACQSKSLRRSLQIAGACVVTFFALWLEGKVSVFVFGLNNENMNYYGVACGVLSLYFAAALFMPLAVLGLMWRMKEIIFLSAVTYFGSIIIYTLSGLVGSVGFVTGFNPFAWQFLFVVAAAIGLYWLERGKIDFGRAGFFVFCILMVYVLCCAKMMFPGGVASLSSKMNLGAIRVVHFAAVAVVVSMLLPENGHAVWRSRFTRVFMACGQFGLTVFCSGVVLSSFASNIVRSNLFSAQSYVCACMVVIFGCFGAAWLRGCLKSRCAGRGSGSTASQR